MGFHRLTVPSYTGGLPGGYDYINNAVSGTPALADGPKVGGLNSGSYYVGLSDDSTSEATNRPHNALAENCDILDDLFRRDIAVRVKTASVTAVGVVASVTIAGAGQYLGAGGTPNTTEGIATFVEVVDSNGDPIFSGGVPVRVTSITGDTPGAGFSSAVSITYNFTPSIPNGTSYQLLYSTRGNLASFPFEQLCHLKFRSYFASRTSYDGSGITTFADGSALNPSAVSNALTTIVGNLGGITGTTYIGSDTLPAWADASVIPSGQLSAQLTSIINDLSGTTLGAAGTERVGGYALLGSSSLTLSPPTVESGVGAPWSLPAGPLSDQIVVLHHAVNESYRVRTFGAAATIDSLSVRDGTILLNAAGGSWALQLPDPTLNAGRRIFLVDNQSTLSPTNLVTLTPFAAESVNNQPTYDLQTTDGRWILLCDGTNWFTFSG